MLPGSDVGEQIHSCTGSREAKRDLDASQRVGTACSCNVARTHWPPCTGTGPAVPSGSAPEQHPLTGKEAAMWNAIVTAGVCVVFVVMVYVWVRWTELERERFANGNSRWLE